MCQLTVWHKNHTFRYYIVVECPSLPGCISQGRTETEALENIKEAIELWIEDAQEHGEIIPTDTHLKLAEV